MSFSVEKSVEILESTPTVLDTMLRGLSDDWTTTNEGGDTWSPYDVVGHLVHGEKNDWIVRVEVILSDGPDKALKPLDRFAQFEASKGKSLTQLLDEFKLARKESLERLRAKNLTEADLSRKGVHPAFGDVTLSQLLATWVAHDLDHISQISRVMAKQYKSDVGPWIEYLKILKS